MPLTGASAPVSTPARSSPDSDVAGEITGSRRLGPTAIDADRREIDRACGPSGIGEREAVADHERLQKRFRELEAGIGGVGGLRGALLRREPNPRWLGHTSEHVARRPDLDHAGTGLERTSAELGPGQVHEHATGTTGRQFGSTEMLDHARPCAFVIMRTVDTHAVHTVLDQMLDQAVVDGRLAGHGDHDRDAAVGWHRPEQGVGVRTQKMPPTFQIHRRLVRLLGLPLASDRPMENRKHGVNGSQDMRFCAPKGRQAHACQPHLKRSKVAATQRDVVQKVHRALALTRVNVFEQVERLICQVNEIPADLKCLVNQLLELGSWIRPAGVPRTQ